MSPMPPWLKDKKETKKDETKKDEKKTKELPGKPASKAKGKSKKKDGKK